MSRTLTLNDEQISALSTLVAFRDTEGQRKKGHHSSADYIERAGCLLASVLRDNGIWKAEPAPILEREDA